MRVDLVFTKLERDDFFGAEKWHLLVSHEDESLRQLSNLTLWHLVKRHVSAGWRYRLFCRLVSGPEATPPCITDFPPPVPIFPFLVVRTVCAIEI